MRGPGATVAGIDEAGRGSWIGPLVVAAVVVPAEQLPDVAAVGARDSKQLTPEARERIYGEIARRWPVRAIALRPREIDRHVARGRLNHLEAGAFARLVRTLAPDRAIVDACDTNADRFGREIVGLSGGRTQVVARHKADRDHPIVGAASIVAKVRRDRAVRRLAARLGEELGSGYPSDARTIEFVRRAVPPGAPVPSWLRASWSTTKRVIPERPARTLDGYAP